MTGRTRIICHVSPAASDVEQGNSSHPHYQAEIRISAEHPSVPGHFPGNPIVPGVLVLEQVTKALRDWRDQRLSRLVEVKFLSPLRPGERAELSMEETSGRIRFEVRRESQIVARGIMESEA